MPLDGRREPEAVGAGPVVLELRQRRHALHHDRCDAYDCAERPYSRDAAAWTHDVALAVHVDHFLLSYGVAARNHTACLMQAKDGRTDAFLYFSSSAWLTRQLRICSECLTMLRVRRKKRLRQLAACRDTSKQTKRAMQSFEYRSVRYWSKEIGGTYWGPKNEFF